MGYHPTPMAIWREDWDQFFGNPWHSSSQLQPEETAMTLWSRLFCEHPRAAGESYFEHMGFALGFAGQLMVAAGAAFVHAAIPALCETTASTRVMELSESLAGRRAMLTRGRAENREAPRGA
jgi:hypothetical protein